jgi:hypothetical protein
VPFGCYILNYFAVGVGALSNNSTSKMMLEFGGITFPAPLSP